MGPDTNTQTSSDVSTSEIGNDEKRSVSSVAADDTHCCFSEDYESGEWYLSSGPHTPMLMLFPPVIIVLGTFGNVMTIVIMRRMSEGQSSNSMSLYFTALALSDLVILYAGLLRDWLRFYFGLNMELVHIFFCKLLPFLVYSSGTISAWLIVSMTMQRVMSVVWPHHKSLSCTKRKVGVTITIVFVIPVALNSYSVFSNDLVTIPKSGLKRCYITNKYVKWFEFVIYPWIDLVVSSFIPFTILIVGNSVLLWKVIQSVHVARVMTAGGCDQVNSRQKKASSLTLTLITMSLMFLLLSMPVCIYLLFYPYLSVHSSIFIFVFTATNLAWYANSAINFYLYCLTGSKFRSELKFFFCGRSLTQKLSTFSFRPDDTTRVVDVRTKNNNAGSIS